MVRKVLIQDDEETPIQNYGHPDRIAVTDSVTGATAETVVQASEDNGQASATTTVIDAVDAGATISKTATTAGGAALVSLKAVTTAAGTATARLDADAGVSGDGSARVGVVSGVTVNVGLEATFVNGVGRTLLITDGDGETGDPGDVLTASATVGSTWLPPSDPLTSAGTIVISADGGGNVVTLGDDGSFEVNGAGVVRLLGLPTADPVVAGQLWDGAGLVRLGNMVIPELPAIPTPEDIADALVALGLVTQAS